MAFMGDDRRRQGKQCKQNGRNTTSGPGRDEEWSGHGVIPRAWFRLACAADSRERLRTPSMRASVVWDWARSSSTSEVSPSSNARRISVRRSAAACSRSTASAAPSTGRFELRLGFEHLGLDFGDEPPVAGLGLDQGGVGAGHQGRMARFDGERDADGKTNAVARGSTGQLTIAAIEHSDTRRLAA
jgi:hypothetical protein